MSMLLTEVKSFSTHESLLMGIEYGALWDAKTDLEKITKYVTKLRQLQYQIKKFKKMSRMCKKHTDKIKWDTKAFESRFEKTRILDNYINNISMFNNDQKYGLVWQDGSKFEPHEEIIVKNKITWYGLSLFTSILAEEESIGINYIRIGTDNSEVKLNQQSLVAEKSYQPLRTVGDIFSNGNVLLTTCPFSPNLESGLYLEFGGTQTLDGPLIFRSIIEDATKGLNHVMNSTLIVSSHAIVFVPR